MNKKAEKKSFEHLLLTCFNVKRNFKGGKSEKLENQRNEISYLNYRFDLFETITYPSVCHQSCKNFTWLVFFDQNTPEQFKQKNTSLQDNNKIKFKPIYVNNQAEIYSIIQQQISPDTQYLITTNLDNDDAIASDFIANIQGNFKQQEIYLMNLPLGYMLFKGELFLREYFPSPFHTLVEKVDQNLITCLKFPHYFLDPLDEVYNCPIYQIITKPAWLQIVHQTNITNKKDINSVPISLSNQLKKFNIKGLSLVDLEIKKTKISYRNFYLSTMKKKRAFSFKIKLLLYALLPQTALWYNQLKFFYKNRQNRIITKQEFITMIEDLKIQLSETN